MERFPFDASSVLRCFKIRCHFLFLLSVRRILKPCNRIGRKAWRIVRNCSPFSTAALLLCEVYWTHEVAMMIWVVKTGYFKWAVEKFISPDYILIIVFFIFYFNHDIFSLFNSWFYSFFQTGGGKKKLIRALPIDGDSFLSQRCLKVRVYRLSNWHRHRVIWKHVIPLTSRRQHWLSSLMPRLPCELICVMESLFSVVVDKSSNSWGSSRGLIRWI